MTDSRIVPTVRHVLSMMVKGDYQKLEEITGRRRLSKEELAQAIRDYGRKLKMPPAEAMENLEFIELLDADPQGWAICVDLWTEEEGRSDLSLELTLRDKNAEHLDIQIDNLHVL